MKRIIFLLAVITFLSNNIFGQAIPKQISYQGVLKDAAGNILTGDFAMTFKIYNDPTGGSALWTEIQAVAVANGLFSVQLGSINPITTVPFDRIHFLGITVGTGSELTPRTLLSPSPYSFMAMNVLDNSITTSKIQNGAVTGVKIGSNEVVKSLNGLKDNIRIVSGTNVSITLGGDSIAISATGIGGGITGSGTTNYIPRFTSTNSVGNSELFQIGSDIGIGTTSPLAKLDVRGNIITGIDGSGGMLTLAAQDNANEGGQIIFNGAGSYDDWRQDSYFNSIRFFTNSTNTNTIEIFNVGSGTAGLNIEGYVGIGTTTPYYPLQVSTNRRYAGYFTTDTLSASAHVIHGEYLGTGNIDAIGVYGKSTPANNYGLGGYFVGGYMGAVGSVFASGGSSRYFGVYGKADGESSGEKFGVRGNANGTGTFNYGIYGSASGATTNWAGYFGGNVKVEGQINPTAGSFQIDHPLDPANKYLNHSFVESPDMMNIYNGNVVTDGSGYSIVTLPNWFEVLNKDFRYQLTVIGEFAQAIISQEVQNNQFSIRTDKPNVKVSWQVTGIRKDPWAEKNRILVEENKQSDQLGKYLHPEVYGMPKSMGVDYENNRVDREKEIK
jgi:hypothetical protein